MIRIPKGTKDVLPKDSYIWQYIEAIFRSIGHLFGYKEMRTPTFEHTEVFLRGIGENTDIVNKEMYTFIDKGNRSITLKPEGTAGIARAFVEKGMASFAQPIKVYYITPVFRYERPQAGRLREHHQLGVELFGSASPVADVEVIQLVNQFFKSLKVTQIELKLNNIGCAICRPSYNKDLKDYFLKNIDDLCELCQERIVTNPLRILDCKNPICMRVTENAPKSIDYLCESCRTHWGRVCFLLGEAGVSYTEDHSLVRGLDYYTGTVFEFVSTKIGAQGTVCGGGRYNDLISDIGGPSIPAIGFGMGIERLILLLEQNNISIENTVDTLVYIATIDENATLNGMKLSQRLRENGINTEMNLLERTFKNQLKYANKRGIPYIIVIGDEEIATGEYPLKNLSDGKEVKLSIENLVKRLKDV